MRPAPGAASLPLAPGTRRRWCMAGAPGGPPDRPLHLRRRGARESTPAPLRGHARRPSLEASPLPPALRHLLLPPPPHQTASSATRCAAPHIVRRGQSRRPPSRCCAASPSASAAPAPARPRWLPSGTCPRISHCQPPPRSAPTPLRDYRARRRWPARQRERRAARSSAGASRSASLPRRPRRRAFLLPRIAGGSLNPTRPRGGLQ
mmetsp:Transcript_68229/g.163331  ORF Transcript_68229/g.163331 Transcript_68229/m.163331 type:complete len:206 (-) Transcript_68229:679-1296(-)